MSNNISQNNMSQNKAAICLLGCAVILALSGCISFGPSQVEHVEVFHTDQPAELFIANEYHQLQPKRILLMIPENNENQYEVHQRVADALRASLSRLGIFEVVLNAGICDVSIQSIKQGTFEEVKPEPVPEPEPEEESSYTWLWAVLGVALLVLAL